MILTWSIHGGGCYFDPAVQVANNNICFLINRRLSVSRNWSNPRRQTEGSLDDDGGEV